MNARDEVLARIAAALDRPDTGKTASIDNQPPDVTARLQGAHRHTLPRVGDDLVTTLMDSMESVLISVVRLQSINDCVAAIDWYLESEGIDASSAGSVTIAPALDSLAWPQHFASGPASGVEKVSVTPCIAAVAETGSIVTISGQQTPATLNFLPETHIIVVRESQVVRHVDDVFPLIRSLDILPRAVNFVTGPSRTADIEQTLEIGAHGPRRMHVLLLPD
ncbi:MAG: lactate utilization protein C [Granulosicoccus sp.]